MSFFSAGKVDTRRVNRDKLPAGVKGAAVYRVRITDAAMHLSDASRDEVKFVVVGGPLDGTSASDVVFHKQDKAWKEPKARGQIAIMFGCFLGMDADRAGFKFTNEVHEKNVRVVKYNGNTVSEMSCEADDLPLVKAGAEAFLVVSPYFDKNTGKRKVNPKTGQLSVTYDFKPLSANLTISDKVEDSRGNGEEDDTDETSESVSDEPEMPTEVDALALALADGWKPNGTSGYYYNSKDKTAKQLKEPALRAAYTK